MSKNLHEQSSEILAKVIDLPKKDALRKIEDLCEKNENLKSNVIELYLDIESEDFNKDEQDFKPESPSKSKIRVNPLPTKIFGQLRTLLLEKKWYRYLSLSFVFILLIVIGMTIRNGFKKQLLKDQQEKLEALLDIQSETLLQWMQGEDRISNTLSQSSEIIEIATYIDSIVSLDDSYELLKKQDLQSDIFQEFDEIRERNNLEGLSILHKDDPVVLLLSEQSASGNGKLFSHLELAGVFYDYMRASKKRGIGTTHFPPLPDYEILIDIPEGLNVGTYISFSTPILKDSAIISYMFTQYNVKNKFSEIMNNADHGKSAKVFAFSWDMKLLSTDRFEKELQQTYLLDFDSTKSSIQSFEIKDPGSDITDGSEPAKALIDQDYTTAMDEYFLQTEVTGYQDARGVIMMPYRDHRGVEVVGAWAWYNMLGFGLVAEEDAYEVLLSLRYFDVALILFFIILAILILMLNNLNVKFLKFGKKWEEFEKVGQYLLQEKLGEGGFGTVYKAKHSFLKSEVAIKLLKKEFIGTDALDRFEKEVKASSSLSHPNTIRVYDYGTTDSGQFYYVMEYLSGLSLDKVVQSYDEFPSSRAIYILLNTCYSLKEAHEKGLVHRDIKPANIMLCNQGGAYDVLKVLDFGLVKNVDASVSQQTQINRIGGTPMFMAPERLRDPFNADQRVDIYAIGAVGLYIFSGQYIVELISQKMLSGQDTISGGLNNQLIQREDIPTELKNLLMDCVHFDVEKRPKNMDELIIALEKIQEAYSWTRKEAEQWWKSYDVYS